MLNELEQRLAHICGDELTQLKLQRYAPPELVSLGYADSWKEYVLANDFSHGKEFLLSVNIQKMMDGAISDGSTCVPLITIIDYANEYYPGLNIKPTLKELISGCGYAVCNEHLFKKTLLEYEETVSSNINRIKKAPHFMEAHNVEKSNRVIEYLAKKGLSQQKQRCAEEILKSKIYLLRGLPGSGKTTLVQELVKGLLSEQVIKAEDVIILAPTNKSASRASFIKDGRLHVRAKTYHKGLGYNPYSDTYIFRKERKLPYKFIVVEECGLLDAMMLSRILDAAGSFASVLLCGDEEQLQSIAPGDCIRDLLTLGVDSTQLTEAFRYETSHINNVARDIIAGTHAHALKGDSVFLIRHDKQDSDKQLLNVIWRMGEAAQCDPINDIQILSAGYKGQLGVNHVNKLIHSVISDGASGYVVGERVIFLENINDVARGDVGTISKVSSNQNRIWIETNNKTMTLVGKDIKNIELAHCLTVHKAQGCEFNHVILLLDNKIHDRLITKRLLLTAITRAKKSITIIGESDALAMGLRRDTPERNTYVKTLKKVGEA